MALTTFSDLVQEARERVQRDAISRRPARRRQAPSRRRRRCAAPTPMRWRCIWRSASIKVDRLLVTRSVHVAPASKELVRNIFGRQAIPMTWDYRGGEHLSAMSAGNVSSGIGWAQKALSRLPTTDAWRVPRQADAAAPID